MKYELGFELADEYNLHIAYENLYGLYFNEGVNEELSVKYALQDLGIL